MQISVIILFIINLDKDYRVRILVNFFFENFSETIDWIFTKFHRIVPNAKLTLARLLATILSWQVVPLRLLCCSGMLSL